MLRVFPVPFPGRGMIATFYFVCYLLLLQPELHYGVSCLNVLPYERVPAYRVGGDVAGNLFAPLQWADRMVRPTYWRGLVVIDTSDLDIPPEPASPTRPQTP